MFVVFAWTDWLDGFLARKLNQTSSFGAFLDPVADKFLVCASLLVLVHLHRADVFVALIIIGREIAISRCASGWPDRRDQKRGGAHDRQGSRPRCRWWPSRFCCTTVCCSGGRYTRCGGSG
jgi:hypothetical protein